MALNFDPSVYLQIQQQNDQRREADRKFPLEALSMFGQQIGANRDKNLAAQRQATIDQLLQQKTGMELQAHQSKYGIPIDPGVMTPVGTGQIARSSMMPGGQGQVGSGGSLVEKFNTWRSGGMKKEGAQPEFMGALGEDERKVFYEGSNPSIKTVSYQAKDYIDSKGRTRIGKWNPQTGMLERSETDEYAPQAARGETAGNLRKEFIDRPEVKDYQTVATQVKSMDSLLSQAKSGNAQSKNFLDQALISIFNKINDPGSVIRESEYARTPEGLALSNRIQGSLEKIRAGGAGLTDADRADLVVASKIIANERGGTYNQTRSGYVNLAQQMTLDPQLITATMPEFSPYSFQAAQPGTSPTPTFQDPGKEARYQQWKASQSGGQ